MGKTSQLKLLRQKKKLCYLFLKFKFSLPTQTENHKNVSLLPGFICEFGSIGLFSLRGIFGIMYSKYNFLSSIAFERITSTYKRRVLCSSYEAIDLLTILIVMAWNNLFDTWKVFNYNIFHDSMKLMYWYNAIIFGDHLKFIVKIGLLKKHLGVEGM